MCGVRDADSVMLTRILADDREFLLRDWKHADFCHVNHNVDRVYAQTFQLRCGCEQLLSKHIFLCGSNSRGASY